MTLKCRQSQMDPPLLDSVSGASCIWTTSVFRMPRMLPQLLSHQPLSDHLTGGSVFTGLLQMKDLVSALLIFFLPSLYYNQEVMFFM